ncbi:MAG: DNA replication initiation control protein YabA [Syntrophomonadaceae bacterium]|nr:DNA replication initiation control protein YabA [Syntrophomonadaceae bacterium]
MEKTVQELKNLIMDLIYEIGSLKERVAILEEEKPHDRIQKQQRQIDAVKLQGESYTNLGRIYAEGFHVCPVAYGEPRQEDGCLFCMAFMGKE